MDFKLPSLLKGKASFAQWFKQLTAGLWNAAGTAWRLSNEVTDGCACHHCLKPGLLQHVQFGMKACTTNKSRRRACVTSVCCALWWLTVHLPGHMKELTTAESAKEWRAGCLWATSLCIHTMYNWLELKCFWFSLEASLAEKSHLARWSNGKKEHFLH